MAPLRRPCANLRRSMRRRMRRRLLRRKFQAPTDAKRVAAAAGIERAAPSATPAPAPQAMVAPAQSGNMPAPSPRSQAEASVPARQSAISPHQSATMVAPPPSAPIAQAAPRIAGSVSADNNAARQRLVRALHRMKRRAMSRVLSMSIRGALARHATAISRWQRSTRCARDMTMRMRGYLSTCANGRRGSRTRCRRNSSPSRPTSPASGRGSDHRDVAYECSRTCAVTPIPFAQASEAPGAISLPTASRRSCGWAPAMRRRARPRASATGSRAIRRAPATWSTATRRGWIVSAKCVNVCRTAASRR